jgi:hypothetical protein
MRLQRDGFVAVLLAMTGVCFVAALLAMTGGCFGLRPLNDGMRDDEKKPAEAGI